MPSPRARELTSRHRQQLRIVAEVVRRRMRRLLAGATPADIDAWWARVEPEAVRLVLRGADAAATLGERYLRRHALLEGVELEPVRAVPGRQQVAESLRVTGPVGFKTHMARTGSEAASLRAMAERMTGAATRHTMSGERDTIMRTFAERDEIVGWRRVDDGDPCAFCAMLVSRGAVYDKDTVRFQAHDSDGCTPEPLYRREAEPPEVRRLYEEWVDVTAGTSGAESVRAWRQHWESR